MKELIEMSKVNYSSEKDLVGYAEELAEIGFKTASKKMLAVHHKFLKIPEANIIEFLKKKHLDIFKDVPEQNQLLEKECIVDSEKELQGWTEIEEFTQFIAYKKLDMRHNYKYFILSWKETPIRQYENIPPDTLIERFKTSSARECFDSFTIATLHKDEYTVKDPLWLGRINGCTDRYLIGQWDEDILVDDLI